MTWEQFVVGAFFVVMCAIQCFGGYVEMKQSPKSSLFRFAIPITILVWGFMAAVLHHAHFW